MGSIEYAVVAFPHSDYEDDARDLLGAVFDIGVNVMGCSGDELVQAFVASGLAREFETMNPVFVAGKSSYDLLRIMAPLLAEAAPTAPLPRLDRSPDWWLGWIIVHFQRISGYSYRTIFDKASYNDLRAMYWPLHEAPESKFIEVVLDMMNDRDRPTRLRRLREAAGLSQSQLAERSGVGIRSIQLYEQRQKDINKAQAISLFALATALRCSMEQLLER